MKRRWLLKKTNAEYVKYLSQAASVSPALAQVLINRGVKTPEEAAAFLWRTPRSAKATEAVGGTSEAVSAIKDALGRGARVFVHGDYDVDGLTATAIMVEGLRALGLDAVYFVPNRFKDGYGFNPPAVKLAAEAGAGLIITVDCGMSSFEAAREARAAGMGLVITDHHEPTVDPAGGLPLLPVALAVINPKLAPAGAGDPSLAYLSGAGVALKLVEALALEFPGLLEPAAFLDLAALGTMADSVPLTGENRAVVKKGLADVFSGRRAGVRALCEVSGFNGRRPRAGAVPFTLVPRMNAAGRMADSADVVELLLTGSEGRAMEIARSLDRQNTERQATEDRVLAEALGGMGGPGAGIVLAGRGWHEGVIGIVAAKVAERFHRPTVIFSINGEAARGSARSIPDFDLFKGLSECSGLLTAFGGHRQAAGLRIKASEIPAFSGAFSEAVERAAPDFTPTLGLDAAVELREVSTRFVAELSELEPFGPGNPEPVLAARDLAVLSPRVVGGNHLKMKLRARGYALDAIGFNMGGLLKTVEEAAAVDAAFTASFNEWEGRRALQLNLKALREAGGETVNSDQ